MKKSQQVLSIIISVTAIVILLITSFEIGAYSDYGWYEKTYVKYNVLEELDMEMADVMHVTKEMMSYLRGNRADLVVLINVDGIEREFFNDREKAHMIDVKNLFVSGLWIRRIAVCLLCVAIIVLIKIKADWKRVLLKSFLVGLGSIIGITAGAGILFMSDFNKYFTLFHKVFFTNDLWLLDPRTDLLIRMLPEGFFLDMVTRIGIIFLIFLSVGVVIGIIALHRYRNKNN